MNTYAIVISLAFGYVMGILSLSAWGAWIDGREIEAARQKRLQEEKDDAEMRAAVALVSDKLGATVIPR